LALLPLAATPEVWTEIKPQVCDRLNPEILDDLRLDRVLESAEPPSFGHAKRWDAARTWFMENRTIVTRQEAENLILYIASRVRDPSVDPIVPVAALISLQTSCDELDLRDLHRGLCETAAILVAADSDATLTLAYAILRAARAARTEHRAAHLIARGLAQNARLC
jgi:hypothetical protein